MNVSSNAYVGSGRRVAAHYKIAWAKDMLSPTPRRQISAVIFYADTCLSGFWAKNRTPQIDRIFIAGPYIRSLDFVDRYWRNLAVTQTLTFLLFKNVIKVSAFSDNALFLVVVVNSLDVFFCSKEVIIRHQKLFLNGLYHLTCT